MPKRASALVLGIVLGGLHPGGAFGGDFPAEALEFFEKDVRPLLVAKCQACHGDTKPKSRLRLSSRASVLEGGVRGPAAIPGKPADSLLLQAVRHQDDLRMPPRGKLTARQVEVLERWIRLGLP